MPVLHVFQSLRQKLLLLFDDRPCHSTRPLDLKSHAIHKFPHRVNGSHCSLPPLGSLNGFATELVDVHHVGE